MILGGIIPAEIVQNYFYFHYESPNIYSLFLSKFVHDPGNPMHLNDNILSFLIISAIIGILYFYIFPKVEIKMPDHFLTAVYIQIVFLVPFFVSLISYIYRQIGVISDNIQYSIGFSGTIWALMGFMLFLTAVFCLRALSLKLRDQSGDDFTRIISVCLPVLFVVSLMVILPVFYIFVDVNTSKNVYAHLAGFAYGWLIPTLSGTFLVSACWTCRITNFLMIVGIFILPFIVAGLLVVF